MAQRLSKEKPITERERNVIIPIIKKSLIGLYLRGVKTPINSTRMLTTLQKSRGIKLSPARLRKLLYHITIEGFGIITGNVVVLCSNNLGYFMSDDPKIVREYIESLKLRTSTQLHKIQSVERDLATIEERKQLSIHQIVDQSMKESADQL